MITSSIRTRLVARWRSLPRTLRFVIVGLVNTAFGYSAYVVLLLAGVTFPLAALFATIAGVAFNYFTTGGLVFEDLSRAALARFIAAYVLIYLVNVACIAMLCKAGVDAYAAGLILILPMAAFAYVLMSQLVFGGRRGAL